MVIVRSHRINSLELVKFFWQSWRILGVNSTKNKWINRSYDILLNVFVTLWYPIHLTVGLFMLPMQGDVFKNLSITITCIVCSFKHICLRWKLHQFQRLENLLAELDERSQSREEYKYFNEVCRENTMRLVKMFLAFYMGSNIAAVISVLSDAERRLMYPAWFPFEWQSSTSLYWLAMLYQFVGVTIQIIQNLVSDTVAPVSLCLMSGHVRLLSLRAAKLGYDPKKSEAEHYNDLKLCVDDHVKLLELFQVVEDSLSYAQLVLFVSSGLNICVVLVYLVFYAENLPTYLYYSVFTMALGVELFPCYYYGSVLQLEFEDLSYAIFCSNWPEQPKRFRRDLIIFVETTLRTLKMLGGGIVGIRLESFFAICKMAYSLFTLVIRIK